MLTTQTKEGWEACLPVESLQSRGEDGRAGRLAVPAVQVGLVRVDAGRAGPLAAVVVAHALPVLPLVPGAGLLQGLAEQGLVVAVGVLVLAAGGLHLVQPGRQWSGPGISLSVVPGHLSGGVPAGQQGGRYRPRPRPLGQGGVVVSLALLVVRVGG